MLNIIKQLYFQVKTGWIAIISVTIFTIVSKHWNSVNMIELWQLVCLGWLKA